MNKTYNKTLHRLNKTLHRPCIEITENSQEITKSTFFHLNDKVNERVLLLVFRCIEYERKI
jgi:hypothetical protein